MPRFLRERWGVWCVLDDPGRLNHTNTRDATPITPSCGETSRGRQPDQAHEVTCESIKRMIARVFVDLTVVSTSCLPEECERSSYLRWWRVRFATAMSRLTALMLAHSAVARRDGSVKTRWRESEVGPRRRYYALTEDGRVALEQCMVAWVHFLDAVDALLQQAED